MDESGATTAEYAVGTLGAVGFAAMLIHIGLGPWYDNLLWDVIRHALDPNVLLHHLATLPRLSWK